MSDRGGLPVREGSAKLVRMEPRANARDIALGLALTGARAGAFAARVALLPLRATARTPLVGPVLREAGDELAGDSRAARRQLRGRVEDAADQVLASPEAARTVDHALAGPLADAVARSLAEHRIPERVAGELLTAAEVERAVAATLEHETTRRAVEQALASPGLERLLAEMVESRLVANITDRVLESEQFAHAVEQVASSPAVRTALMRQTTSLADELVEGIRARAVRFDDGAERRVRGWVRRPAPTDRARVRFGGLSARTAAFAVDLGIAHVIALTGAALLALVVALVGDLRPGWLAGTLVGGGWLLVVGTYLVLFWTVTGQTPGMRLMRLRVADARGDPPRVGRAVLRFFGLLLAIVPLFAGLVPVLFDDRRRALQDFLAGTVVLDAERWAPADGPAPALMEHAPSAAPGAQPR
jgi:uncharacterized RDD family membrane protein YckC